MSITEEQVIEAIEARLERAEMGLKIAEEVRYGKGEK